jgi:hypothetical protein
MEWRCEWCGKPHAEDDPPCDNCGHGTFEEAIVQVPGGDPGSGETTVWVCDACGRTHPKNSPPCSRCGNASLEREVRGPEAYDDIGAPGYRDLVTPRYLLGLVGVLALAAVFVLGVTGVVDVPGLTRGGVPEVADVPGSATEANGVDLAAVEAELRDVINERREAAGYPPLSADDHLDKVATFFTQHYVRAQYGDGSLPTDDRLRDLIGDRCAGGSPVLVPHRVEGESSVSTQSSPEAAAQALVELFPADSARSKNPGTGIQGLDVHVGPDGTTFLTQLIC